MTMMMKLMAVYTCMDDGDYGNYEEDEDVGGVWPRGCAADFLHDAMMIITMTTIVKKKMIMKKEMIVIMTMKKMMVVFGRKDVQG